MEFQEKSGNPVNQAELALKELQRKLVSGIPKKKKNEKLLEGYQKGVRALAFLRKKDARIQYSPISELELSAGRLKGKAVEALAKEQVPDRMWSNLVTNDRQVAARITQRNCRDIRSGIDKLVSRLGKVDIEVMKDNSGPIGEVWDIANGITGILYMTPADCIIFASALAASAEYLLTNDGYLREVVNRVRQAGSAHDKAVQDKIRDLMSSITLHNAKDLRFPVAPLYHKKERKRVQCKTNSKRSQEG